jgi:hypothetical protein
MLVREMPRPQQQSDQSRAARAPTFIDIAKSGMSAEQLHALR